MLPFLFSSPPPFFFFSLYEQLHWGNPRDALVLCRTRTPLRVPAGRARSGAAGLPGTAGWQMGLFVVWLLAVPLATLGTAGWDGLNVKSLV